MTPSKLLFLPMALGVVLVCEVHAQGTFGNLNFETAQLPNLPFGQRGSLNGVLVSDALPLWTAFYGTSSTPMITHNATTLGQANISVLGPYWGFSDGMSILEGNYSVVLQAGQWQGLPVTVSIAQTGQIPPGTQSIELKINSLAGIGLTFGGHDIPMVPLNPGPPIPYITMGGDISSYAGQSGELRLIALNDQTPFTTFEIDSIAFSTERIPEPKTIGLLGVAASALGAWCSRRRR